jgi:hypothetical protein
MLRGVRQFVSHLAALATIAPGQSSIPEHTAGFRFIRPVPSHIGHVSL